MAKTLDLALLKGTVAAMVDKNYNPPRDNPWSQGQLLPAEKILLETAKIGDRAEIRTDLKLPAEGEWTGWAEKHQIRAKVIRHLLLHPTIYGLDPKGIKIRGAHIIDELGLENLDIDLQVQFGFCLFDDTPVLQHARLRTLTFHACRLPGLDADGLHVQGGLFLRHSLFTGEVRLLGAQVTGHVTCSGATFSHQGKDAFNADGFIVGGSIFLVDVTMTGATRLVGAQVAGYVNCSGATFANSDGYAFHAQRLTVTGRLFWRNMAARPNGTVDFNHARVGDFLDDEPSWPHTRELKLEGFVYDSITTDVSVDQRIEWLALLPKTLDGDEPVFWPQPYEQLIKVFKATGHERDARLVAMKKQDVYRRYLEDQSGFVKKLRQFTDPSKRIQFLTTTLNDMAKNHEDRAKLEKELKKLERIQILKIKYADHRITWPRRLWLRFLKPAAGYGYAPWRALIISAMIIILGAFIFEAGYVTTNVLPAKDRAYINKCFIVDKATNTGSSDKVDKVREDGACKEFWSPIRTQRIYQPDHISMGYVFHLPTHYVSFQPLAYSIDVFIPILDLQQETSWMPKSGWYRTYMWFHIALGWIFTTIAVAGFSGLIKKD